MKNPGQRARRGPRILPRYFTIAGLTPGMSAGATPTYSPFCHWPTNHTLRNTPPSSLVSRPPVPATGYGRGALIAVSHDVVHYQNSGSSGVGSRMGRSAANRLL